MTHYTVAIDDTLAGWKTVDWIDDALVDHDRVRFITVSEFAGEALDRSEHRLAAAQERIESRHPLVEATTDVTGGPTVDRLVHDGGRGDVLVIGGRQTDAFAAALTGRTAERVVAHATSIVVVVPERWERSDGPVVVGVDSRTAGPALALGARLAAAGGRELLLVRAWDPLHDTQPFGAVYLLEDRGLWEDEAKLELEAAIRGAEAVEPGLRVRGVLREGRPADELLAEAAHASLVVVGRSHRSALGAFLGGSVGEALMHHGHAPVYVVPPSTPVDAQRVSPSAAVRGAR